MRKADTSTAFPPLLRLTWAVLWAPFPPVMLCTVLVGLGLSIVDDGHSALGAGAFTLMTAFVGFALAYPAMLFMGLPLYLILRRRGPATRRSCVVGGLWVGLVFPLLMGGALWLLAETGSTAAGGFWLLPLMGAAPGGPLGALSGVFFWAVIRPQEQAIQRS